MNQKFDELKLIRDTAYDNAKEAGKAMTERTNKSSNPLTLDIGDFVYMLTDPAKSFSRNILDLSL